MCGCRAPFYFTAVTVRWGTASVDGVQNFVEFNDGFSSPSRGAGCAGAFVPTGVRVVYSRHGESSRFEKGELIWPNARSVEMSMTRPSR